MLSPDTTYRLPCCSFWIAKLLLYLCLVFSVSHLKGLFALFAWLIFQKLLMHYLVYRCTMIKRNLHATCWRHVFMFSSCLFLFQETVPGGYFSSTLSFYKQFLFSYFIECSFNLFTYLVIKKNTVLREWPVFLFLFCFLICHPPGSTDTAFVSAGVIFPGEPSHHSCFYATLEYC